MDLNRWKSWDRTNIRLDLQEQVHMLEHRTNPRTELHKILVGYFQKLRGTFLESSSDFIVILEVFVSL